MRGSQLPPQSPPAVSLDHLVGTGEEGGRDREAECTCSLEVQDQLKLCRLSYRQVAGLHPVQDLVNIACGTPKRVKDVRTISHQGALVSEITKLRGNWDLLPFGKLDNPRPISNLKSVLSGHHCFGTKLGG